MLEFKEIPFFCLGIQEQIEHFEADEIDFYLFHVPKLLFIFMLNIILIN